MSDMTSLSHEYAASADFARQFNDAVLRLKQWCFTETGIPVPGEEEVLEARRWLAHALQDLAMRLEGQGEPLHTYWDATPGEVVDRLINKHKSRMASFVHDLRSSSIALEGRGPIDRPAIAILDEICDAADASASASFRRLRRR